MPLCETRWYKWWYFENNAWAVMSWEPHMLKSCGVLSVWDSAHMWPEKRVSACLPDTFIWLQLSGGIDNLKPSHVHWAAWSTTEELSYQNMYFSHFLPNQREAIEQYSFRSYSQWTFCLEWWSLFPIFSYIKYVSWEVTLHFLLRSDPGPFRCWSLLSLLCQTCSYQHRKRTFFFLALGPDRFFPPKYVDDWINGPNIIEREGGFLEILRHRSQPYL